MTISVVLWDADGVLQDATPGWIERLVAIGGPDFPDACRLAERPALAGECRFVDAMTAVIAAHGLSLPVADLVQVWTTIDIFPDALDIVAEVRAAGPRCVLATNQQDHRWAAMEQLRHLEGMHAHYPSYQLGVAKPDPGYFRAILAAEGIQPTEALFIDDREDNVAAARAVGLAAVRHDPATGAAGLRRILRDAEVLS